MKKPGIILGPVREVSMFAIIESFLKKGIEVIVFDPDKKAPGFYLPGISEKIVSPDPEKNEAEFTEFLIMLGKRLPGYVLLVNDDLYSQLISESIDELKRYYLLLISDQAVNSIGVDKAKTAEASAKYGIQFPRTYFIRNDHDDPRDIEIDFPLVIKPRKLAGSRGQHLVKNYEELSRALNMIGDRKTDYIIQEWIPGSVKNLCTLGTLFDESSHPKALFTARRLDIMRTKRVNQGITTYVISERIPEIIEQGVGFLRSIKWKGIAELEFKFDDRDSKFKLIEINPRIWSWIKLPMKCGIDFAAIYYDLLCGKKFETLSDFKTGVTYLRSITDMYSLFYRLSSGEAKIKSVSTDLFRKYARIVFNPKDNLIDELPWRRPNLQWLLFYYKRLKEYG